MNHRIRFIFFLIMTLWIVYVIDLILPMDLRQWGIYPRQPIGLAGIILSPLLHVNFSHLVVNTVPLFILSAILVVFYDRLAVSVLTVVWLMGGMLIWVFARTGNHIGASGLIYGIAAFLVSYGVWKRNFISIFVSLIIAFFYGGSVISGVLPFQHTVSWESHLFSGASGIFAGFMFRKHRPKHPLFP
ncbi:MAG: rhomboid family intramembrane serine protease [Desulfobacteraceae bacterium]|nr:rhomboid family intramembrane serine protease [Desulfobacteraceae bacterium]